MPEFVVPKRFKRRLNKKKPPLQGAILEAVARLAENPRHPGLQTHRVQGHAGVFEAYVDEANRLTFEWNGPVIVLRNHCNHDMIKLNP
jgi:hypothetical protein